MKNRIIFLTGFAISALWGVYERSQNIGIRDQVFLSLAFVVALFYDYWKEQK